MGALLPARAAAAAVAAKACQQLLVHLSQLLV
jgi:hypothetical protein